VETRIRIRLHDVEVECVGDEAFVVDRLTQLVAELIRQLTGQAPPSVAPGRPVAPGQPVAPGSPPVAPPSGAPGLANIAGVVRDYFSDVVVAGARVQTVGLNPELAGDSDAAGRFVISGQTGGNGLIVVTGPDGYLKTATGPLELSGVSSQVVPAVTQADLNRLHAVLGIQPDQASTVFVQLLTAAGDPLEMVAGTDMGLSQGGNRVGDGPYFFGPSGDVDSNMVLSQAFDSQARAAFFNVPAGLTTFFLTAPSAENVLVQTTVSLVVLQSAVAVVRAQLPV
jgi:hypothetical protein